MSLTLDTARCLRCDRCQLRKLASAWSAEEREHHLAGTGPCARRETATSTADRARSNAMWEREAIKVAHERRAEKRAAQRERYHRRKRVIAERVCLNPDCESPFIPTRVDQYHHDERCQQRAAYLRRKEAGAGRPLQPTPLTTEGEQR